MGGQNSRAEAAGDGSGKGCPVEGEEVSLLDMYLPRRSADTRSSYRRSRDRMEEINAAPPVILKTRDEIRREMRREAVAERVCVFGTIAIGFSVIAFYVWVAVVSIQRESREAQPAPTEVEK